MYAKKEMLANFINYILFTNTYSKQQLESLGASLYFIFFCTTIEEKIYLHTSNHHNNPYDIWENELSYHIQK